MKVTPRKSGNETPLATAAAGKVLQRKSGRKSPARKKLGMELKQNRAEGGGTMPVKNPNNATRSKIPGSTMQPDADVNDTQMQIIVTQPTPVHDHPATVPNRPKQPTNRRNHHDDDDFQQEQPPTKKSKNTPAPEKPTLPHLKSQAGAESLINACRHMNELQLNTVERMGFRDLIHLQVTELPSTIFFWVLRNFNPKSCEIRLRGGQSLHVESEDITLVLGMPSGKIPILRNNKTSQI